MEILTSETLPAYLRTQEIITNGESVQITPIPSMVNHVFRVRTGKGDLIVKQAGSTMSHFADEPITPRRAEIEHAALACWSEIAAVHGLATCVPEVRKYDAKHRTHIFTAIPEPAQILSVHLLQGNPQEGALQKIAHLFAIVHSTTHDSAELRQQFSGTDGLILKMKFFHFHMRDAVQQPELRAKLSALIDTTLSTHLALTHNDTNPKNILINGDTPVLIDYELASYGDPAFDLGTLFGQYYLCAILNFAARQKYFAAIRSAWETYCATCRIPIITEREAVIVQHFSPFVWGRTFGRVSVPHLPTALRVILERISYAILLRPCQSFEESFALVEEYQEELRAIPSLNVEAMVREVSL